MSTSKIRIRIGQVEIEYEGEHAYLNEDLPKLLETLVELRKKAGGAEDRDNDADDTSDDKSSKKALTGSVAAIAAKIKAKQGPDLIIAAATKLTLVDKQVTFSRETLLTAMRSAPGYYKKSYAKNLSISLQRLLTAGRMTESSTDNYALTANEVAVQEKAIA